MNNAWDAVEYKAEIDYWKEKYEMEKSKNLELAKALCNIQECCNGYVGTGPLKTINEIAQAAIDKAGGK